MRKLFNFFAAALVMLAAASCEKNEVLPDNNSEGKVVTLKASINNGGTKTSLGGEKGSDDKYPVLWSEGDSIAVIQEDIDSENYGSVYTFTLSEGGAGKASATFECNNANGFNPDLEYRAVYPASSVVLLDGKFDGYGFSDTQSYVQNSFGVGAMPMQTNMYIGTNNPLIFSNVFGVLKLQLKGAADEKVTSIVITSDNALNGEANLELGKIVLSGASDENKKVTLDCSANGGVALNQDKATDFHIALPAGATGLKVLINTNKGSYYKEVPSQDASSNPINAITAGNILKMPELNTTNMAPAYIENGVYLGDGVALPAEKDSEGNPTKYLIWAPVNCGYDALNTSGLKYNGAINPCPNGWKVPSKNDVGTLNINNNAEILYSEETPKTPVGLKVFGNVSSPTTESKWIFLPAEFSSSTSVFSRYWTSTPDNLKYYYLILNIGYSSTKESWSYQLYVPYNGQDKTTQSYIRCVKR